MLWRILHPSVTMLVFCYYGCTCAVFDK